MVLVGMVAVLAPSLMQWLTLQLKQSLSCQAQDAGTIFADTKAFANFVNEKVINVIIVICPILAALAAGAVLASVAVGGFNFAPQAINFKWNIINPASGLQKLFNARSFVHLFVSIVKLFFISLVVWIYLHNKLETIATLRWAWSSEIIAVIAKTILGLMIWVFIALMVIAIADVIYQKWKYIQDLKMTRQEVKQERRDTVGLPETKSRIRKIQYEMTLRRMMHEVPKANVVLVNPNHVAVALRYESNTMEAPIVVAKGADHLAEKIREIARAYGVPVIRRPELARTIYSTVKVGAGIPENLYVAVAEVLALIYRLRHRKY
jgi:flagellar biosynthetic protein FlhB